MLRATIFSVVVFLLVPTLAVQAPLNSGHCWLAGRHASVLTDDDITDWKLDKLPSPDTTDHLVFETVHSLLQHWPNARMRNGHSIVPGRVPAGTLLYHATNRRELPTGPEWVATDPEYSYFFCHIYYFRQRCWFLTLATTRPLKVIYFDGTGVAKLPYGSLDTQDLIALGRLGSTDTVSDWQRIQELCKWGEKFGLDGFVRMGTDFEVMLCDFNSGVRVVSFVNLANGGDIQVVMSSYVMFEITDSASWHSHFPGETRVQLDLAGLVSFYDTQLVPSLVSIRAGQDRWDHRAGNISSEDLLAVKSRLETTLTGPRGPSSEVDWRTLIQVIVDRYAQRLELIRHLLNSSAIDPDEIIERANQTHTQLRIMLTPYLLLAATPADYQDRSDLDWTIPIYKLCATIHTHLIESELISLTNSEKLILDSIRGTSREICRVVTRMWAAGVYAGIDTLLNTKESVDISEISHLWTVWADDLDGLMKWLDWNVWVKCHPECGAEEMCYLPTWPVGFPGIGTSDRRQPPSSHPNGPHPERPTNFTLRATVTEGLMEEMANVIRPGPDEWIRPQPKCIRRVDPYEY